MAALSAVFLAGSAAPLKVLFYTESSGWEHSVIKRVDGKPSYTEKILAGLAPANNLEFTFSKDGSLFSPQYLAQFDVLMFYTSGDLCSVGTDAQPAMSVAGKQALLDAIAGGKGFVGIHSCSDSFHTGEHGGGNNPIREQRFKLYGEAADPFVKMLGGEFIRHGAQQMAKATVIDPAFPGFAPTGPALEITEEWYSLKEFAPDLHVLLVMETGPMKGVEYQRAPYPLAWAKPYGKGRVWYNAVGHREDVWDNPKYQAMVLGGIAWAGRRVDAAIPANLNSAAPGAAQLPPFAAPPK